MTKKKNHETERPKSNLKLKTQGHKTRTQNVLKNDPNGILFRWCMKPKTWKKGYDIISYFKLVLNRLKVIGGPTPIYTPLGT
jgi:hypothetical protein